MNVIRGIFWEEFLEGIFWEDFFGRIILGGFLGRNSLFTFLKSAKVFEYEWNLCFCQDFGVILSQWKEGRNLDP